MLNHLKLQNVGPAPTMELNFGERLNLITGNNGLGKSFLLDVAWWALTRRWPAEINPKLTAGKKAWPSFPGDASISFTFSGKTKEESYESTYQRKEQAWTGRPGRPANPGLVLYAMTVVFLIDEVEAHLHPAWQRTVIPGILSVMDELSSRASVQLITATHSPLVMTSVEPSFDEKIDAWFDLDFEGKEVVLRRRDFEKHGDAGTWLLSEAFDLPSGRPKEYEQLVAEASQLTELDKPAPEQIEKMNAAVVQALGPTDDFLFSWRYICRQKGWLK